MIPIILLLFFAVALLLPPYTAAMATTLSSFTDDAGFGAVLPPGWITNDFDNTSPEAIAFEDQVGYAKLVTFCSEEDSSLPSLGSDIRTCKEIPKSPNEYVQVYRYKGLDKRPEFTPILQSGRAITANDLFLYHLMELQSLPNSGTPPEAYEDRIQQQSVGVMQQVDANSIERVSTINGLIVLVGYEKLPPPPGSGGGWRSSYNLYFVDPATNDGYRVVSESFDVDLYAYDYRSLSPDMNQIFESIDLVSPAANAALLVHTRLFPILYHYLHH
jgi:hypothetical protein